MKNRTIGKRLTLVRLDQVLPFIFFLFVFFLYFSRLSDPYFTDEQETFVGAYSVIKGKDLYASFHCQHMPFSYYFAVPIALLGARTVFQFRLGIYIMLTIVWETAFLRHRRFFHSETLFAIPLLYLTALKYFRMGTTMLANHWEGIGLVLILLEVVRYVRTKELPLPCAGMVALGISLSLGFSFSSAYSLFCFFLATACIQVRTVQELSHSRILSADQRRSFIRRILRQDQRVVILSLLPFALLLGWYALSENLQNFYVSCFEIVTKAYPQFENPIRVIWTTLAAFGHYLVSLPGQLIVSPWPTLLFIVEILSLIGLSWKLTLTSPTVALLTLLAIIYSGLRDFQGYHSMAFQALTAASLALCYDWAVEKSGSRKKLLVALRGGGALAAVLLLSNFVVWAGYNLFYPQVLQDRTLRSEEQILQLLTEPEEEVCACDMPVNSLDLMDLELVPMDHCFAMIYPYFYSCFGEELMASIQSQPHIVLYNPETRIYGAVYKEYAADFDAYVRTHYTRLPQAESIWVSSAFLPEARRKLSDAGYGNLLSAFPENLQEIYHPEEYLPGQILTTSFVAKESTLIAIRFCGSCYYQRSAPTLAVRLQDDAGVLLAESSISGHKIADNLFSRCPLRANLIPGRVYNLEFSIDQISGKGDMEFYFDRENALILMEEYLVENLKSVE